MNDKLKPALIGGAIAGVLSVIPFVNLCSCLWSIGGGFLAGYLYISQSQMPVTVGAGAATGALAGVVGGAIHFVVKLLLSLAFGAMAGLDEQLRNAGVVLPISGMVLILVSAIVGAIFIIGLATLGGLIAVPVFEKRKSE